VRFKISEAEYLNYVKTRGQRIDPNPIRLILADNTAHPYEGYIKRVLNQFDPRTGTLEVQADFPNPEGLIRPGQFARVRYKSDEKQNALLVPQRAVEEFQGMQSVLTVGPDNQVLARNVVASQQIGEFRVIDQGLKPGDWVIIEGLQKVQPGMVVNPQIVPMPGPAGTGERSADSVVTQGP
jgi:membrane fusion protein (multidrug efflux system)